MMRVATAAVLVLAVLMLGMACSSTSGVKFVKKSDTEIQVLVNGKHFTSLQFNRPDLPKPIFYPVYTMKGTMINRGYPFMDLPNESHDHPHHQSIFFTYDDVNGVGFWNNPKPPPQIVLKEIKRMEDGKDKGVLEFTADWTAPNGKVLLHEDRVVEVSYGPNWRAMDFSMTLTAADTTVVFHDTKEGMFAIRVAPWLKEKGGNGHYINSEGAETTKNVWGRRAKWVTLIGHTDKGEKLSLCFFAHPKSVNYPPYWHARGYGLFAVNPLGQWRFQRDTGVENPQYLNYTLKPGESGLFRYKMIFYEDTLTKDQIDKLYDEWVQSAK